MVRWLLSALESWPFVKIKTIRRVCGKSRSNYYIVKGLTGQWWRHSKFQLYACFASGEGSWLKSSPAGMNRAHGRWGKVRVVFNGDGLLHMVLADVLIHLLHSQRLPVLKKPDRFRSLAPYQFLTRFTNDGSFVGSECCISMKEIHTKYFLLQQSCNYCHSWFVLYFHN